MFVRKKIFAFIFLLLWGVLQNCTVTNNEIIHKQLCDLNWEFSPGDHTAANETGFNDFNWRSIDLPHDWNTDTVLTDSMKKTEKAGKNTETGWYRKNFEIPENWAGKKIVIEFEGINGQHEIFVNGVSVKCTLNDKQQAQADLTPILHLKGNNLIAIRVNDSKESVSVRKNERGIFGHVWLVIKDNGRNP